MIGRGGRGGVTDGGLAYGGLAYFLGLGLRERQSQRRSCEKDLQFHGDCSHDAPADEGRTLSASRSPT